MGLKLLGPTVLYHGSSVSGIRKFKPGTENTWGEGLYLTNEKTAIYYAAQRAYERGGTAVVYEVDVSGADFIDLTDVRTRMAMIRIWSEYLKDFLENKRYRDYLFPAIVRERAELQFEAISTFLANVSEDEEPLLNGPSLYIKGMNKIQPIHVMDDTVLGVTKDGYIFFRFRGTVNGLNSEFRDLVLRMGYGGVYVHEEAGEGPARYKGKIYETSTFPTYVLFRPELAKVISETQF